MTSDAVRDWLRYLKLGDYSDSFIDNGYDDLETVKLIQREDLEAIGVMRKDQQEYIQASVKVLKERGAAWVYLLDFEPDDASEDRIESDNDYCASDKYAYGSGSSGQDSFKSSSYQQSDETVSEESSSEERRLHFNTSTKGCNRGKQLIKRIEF